ncbi:MULTISPECIES: TRAP transporter substrate-binding protein DctP [Limibacillus]|jgi:TRAP-type mannitol/chloroaromatic compound transport system substrate-binding protein|uniref:TRAP-type mannitol/chloroaromatic compound transport system substrate-binding protein n=1 Tax=Limibacillus halophilus TaxID=1579333 RepID=A0A839SSF2_9PROT|nr:TRAP transporter substrate-binding protein DctP [Limibacillus halophilus]MBB3063833.1 TRAP-type mannitol/chloroaromatic compound transport system substrate-binding protein [Limibacillus halophilus]
MLSNFKKSIKAVALGTAFAFGVAMLPAVSKAEPVEWSMATPWSGGHWIDVGAKQFAELVETLTEGRVKINVFPAGTLGSALKVTESVQTGVAEVGHNWPAYDWGIDRTGVIFGGWAGGLTPEEYLLWLYNEGGAELWKEWRMELSDVVAIPCGVLETEIFLHSHKPVRTLEDYQGMKVRTSGAWAEIAANMGASTVIMPGSEVFSALERKVVDGIEWGGPGINTSAGFHKVAKYIVTPGVHQPSGAHECMFNKDAWAKLSEHDQNMIEVAGRLMTLNTFLAYAKDDIDGFAFFQQAGENEMVVLDPSFISAAKEASDAWAAQQAKENDWFKRAYEHQSAFQKKVGDWQKFRLPIGNN